MLNSSFRTIIKPKRRSDGDIHTEGLRLGAERQARFKGRGARRGSHVARKTTTCEQVASGVVYLQDPRTCEQNLRLTQLDSSFFLKGEISKLIDEWREVTEL